MSKLPRDFKGIWISREMWMRTDLSIDQKILWAEINSLDREVEGCTASNKYLCDFFNWGERKLQIDLRALKEKGLIRIEDFDGRIRVLRTCSKTIYENFDTTPPHVSAPPSRTNCHPSTGPHPIVREQSLEQSIDSLVPTAVETRKIYPPEAVQIAEKLLTKVKEVHPRLKPPKMDNWLAEIEKAHRIDKRTWEELMTVVDWAFTDNFWASTLQSGEGLRRNFDKLWAKMQRPTQKTSFKKTNMLTAKEAQSQLRASGSIKAKEFFISDIELVRLDTGSRISLELNPQEFEQKMISMFSLRKS